MVLGWSLLCRGLQALLDSPAPGQAAEGLWRQLEQWALPVWLADWLPMQAITALKTWITSWEPWVSGVLDLAQAWAGWLTPLLWLVWGAGVATLLLLGLTGSALVAALRPSRKPDAAAQPAVHNPAPPRPTA